jgi:hypothetical protein
LYQIGAKHDQLVLIEGAPLEHARWPRPAPKRSLCSIAIAHRCLENR